MKTFRVKEVCKSCKGSGIYVGMAERDGFGIVCHDCKGTGCYEFVHNYEEFELQIIRPDVKQVLQTNPGICVGTNNNLTLESFGGMPYTEWIKDGKFPSKSEMRKYVCPAWWYQSVDYDKKPKWCPSAFGMFSNCPEFENKEACWERFDKENYKP